MDRFSFYGFAYGVFRLVLAVTLFFLFGYLEQELSCGIVVSILLSIYLLMCGARILPMLALIAHFFATYFGSKPGMLLSFVSLDIMFLFLQSTPGDDTTVSLRPYEAQVRSLLFQYNPVQLNRVDAMLDEHIGREQELLYKLRKEYGVNDDDQGSTTGTILSSPNNRVDRRSIATSSARSRAKKRRSTSIAKNENEHQQVPVKALSSTAGTATSVVAATGTDTNSSNGIRDTGARHTYGIVDDIKTLMEENDPSMLHSLDRMLLDYAGQEDELLRDLKTQFQQQKRNQSSSNRRNDKDDSQRLFQSPSPDAAAARATADVNYSWGQREIPSHGYRTGPFSPPLEREQQSASESSLYQQQQQQSVVPGAAVAGARMNIHRYGASSTLSNTLASSMSTTSASPSSGFTAGSTMPSKRPLFGAGYSGTRGSGAGGALVGDTGTGRHRNIVAEAREAARKAQEERINARFGTGTGSSRKR
mmetsp:Transcript_3720/g.5809  ORF Transcript_3720/g.5809 Transcript_3720/m.5809 type:complete len:476 (-) Transcript_3720:186-1613(-)